MTKIIDLSIKEKTYKSKNSQLSILNNFNLEVAAGEKVAIVGESGVGQSSLLNIIGLSIKEKTYKSKNYRHDRVIRLERSK